ncbi:MAG TPA: hypothetical protein VG370_19130 [Chloroflexota bacterium]|jgi:hypothetical protein|nr:hypothetical protein [Chloroflexota bacterium]
MKGILLLALLVASALVACHQVESVLTRTGTPAPGGGQLQDIEGVAQLEARFKEDAGKPRLVILVSPT